VIAHALGVALHGVGAPAIEHKGTLASYLTQLAARDVLFIDEIHRLQPVVEEYLYPAMEDYRIEIPVGDGPAAQLLQMNLPRFTLIGATTRTGLLTSPLRDRFGIVMRLDYYGAGELTEIVNRSARRLGVALDGDAAGEIGQRARGTAAGGEPAAPPRARLRRGGGRRPRRARRWRPRRSTASASTAPPGRDGPGAPARGDREVRRRPGRHRVAGGGGGGGRRTPSRTCTSRTCSRRLPPAHAAAAASPPAARTSTSASPCARTGTLF